MHASLFGQKFGVIKNGRKIKKKLKKNFGVIKKGTKRCLHIKKVNNKKIYIEREIHYAQRSM